MTREPRRGLIIRPVSFAGYSLGPDTHVWLLDSDAERWQVEFRDRQGTLSLADVLECPVSRPTIEQLRKLDPCFGRPDDAFHDEHVSPEHYFVVQRCRAHGAWFLRDTRGTIAMYDRVTLLSHEDGDDWVSIWSRYHAMSDDWLSYKGRTL